MCARHAAQAYRQWPRVRATTGFAAAAFAAMLPITGVHRLAAQDRPPDSTRRLALETYLEIESVADPHISPDGSEIVYGRSWIDRMTDRSISALWIMNADGSANRFLTNGTSPRWSPSGDRLAFTACGTTAGDPSGLIECPDGSVQQLYVRIMQGAGAGAITQVTRLTESAGDIQWSPDGTQLAFTMFVPKQEPGWKLNLPGRPEGAKWTAEPRVIDRLDYRQDRSGFARSGHEHIFAVPSEGGSPRQLTLGDFDHGNPEWSPDGRSIYFDGFRHETDDFLWYAGSYMGSPSKVYSVDTESREIRELTANHLAADRSPLPSPDGRFVAFLSADSTDLTYVDTKLYVMNADGSNRRIIGGDLDRPIGGLVWAGDNAGVYFTVSDQGRRNLSFASLDGAVRPVTTGDHDLRVFDIDGNGTAVAVLSSPRSPGEVVSLALSSPEVRTLTHVNADVLEDITLGDVEDFWTEAPDGLRVHGWIIKPPHFDPSRKYPLVLSIHGGPHGMYGFGFNFSFQHFAASDYVVLYTNPRGSSGYGADFGNGIENGYPGKDADDILAAVDHVVDLGYVDADNLFMTGCSGGGTLTAWIITRTDRFAAAAARCPITNWISFIGTTDGSSWYRQFDSLPWQDPTEHLRRSPLMHVQNVKTPTLVMVGEKDLRTPVPESEQFFAALKIQGVPTRFILFRDEWHGTERNPSNFMRTQLYLMQWFERFMSPGMKNLRGIVAEGTGSGS